MPPPKKRDGPWQGAAKSVGQSSASDFNRLTPTTQVAVIAQERLTGSPGSHAHSDQPNWRSGDDDADELLSQKILDALRNGASERQLAQLLAIPRTVLWRGKLYSQIPPNLYDRLLKARVAQKQILTIAKIFRGDDLETISHEIEYCPNCGHVLRNRTRLSPTVLAILKQWEADGSPHDLPVAVAESAP
jgi:hypothetical protein